MVQHALHAGAAQRVPAGGQRHGLKLQLKAAAARERLAHARDPLKMSRHLSERRQRRVRLCDAEARESRIDNFRIVVWHDAESVARLEGHRVATLAHIQLHVEYPPCAFGTMLVARGKDFKQLPTSPCAFGRGQPSSGHDGRHERPCG